MAPDMDEAEQLRRDSKLVVEKHTTLKDPPPDLLGKAKEKGQRLILWIRDPRLAGALESSRWKSSDWDKLADWGWRLNERGTQEAPIPDYSSIPGISNLVSTQGNQYALRHTEPPIPEISAESGNNYPPTEAHYTNTYFPSNGVIIAERNFGPRITTAKFKGGYIGPNKWNDETDHIPDLFHLSDIWWLSWIHITAPSPPPNIRYVVRRQIMDPEVKRMLYYILRMHWPEEILDGKAPVWPGKTVTPEMKGFEMLVGTPSVWGVAYLLIQRSGQMGERLGIEKITVFHERLGQFFYQPTLIIAVGEIGE